MICFVIYVDNVLYCLYKVYLKILRVLVEIEFFFFFNVLLRDYSYYGCCYVGYFFNIIIKLFWDLYILFKNVNIKLFLFVIFFIDVGNLKLVNLKLIFVLCDIFYNYIIVSCVI